MNVFQLVLVAVILVPSISQSGINVYTDSDARNKAHSDVEYVNVNPEYNLSCVQLVNNAVQCIVIYK